LSTMADSAPATNVDDVAIEASDIVIVAEAA
jgi:hypothetical protein